MKARGEYLKIIMYFIFGITIVMASYLIVLNIHHYKSLSQNVIVSEIDNDYSKYKENIVLIEEKINNYKNTNDVYPSLSKSLTTMKKGGVFRLVPKTKLSYKDLYDLNDFFMEEIINNNWVRDIKELEISTNYQEIINMLVNNSKYINSVFTSNGLTLYDDSLDNKISDNYHFILKNYLMYSNVILSMCNELGGGND